MKKTASNIFLLLGSSILIFGCYLLWERFSPGHVAFSSLPKQTIAQNQTTPPVEINIPSAHIDLQIFPASIHKNTWDLTTSGVSYLTASPLPGNVGNSIIYGHNWRSLLGPLVLVKPKDQITITFSDRTVKRFTVAYVTNVSPSDIQILNPSTDKRITVYTCTGFLDSKRLVVTALAID